MGPDHLGPVAYALFAIPFAAQDPRTLLRPATCNATSCHGATRSERAASAAADAAGRITQDEYTTWFLRDPHRKAFEALSAPLGRAMGKRLGIDVTRAAECLACHAVPGSRADATGGEPGSPQLAEFGVSCEACHGAASGWYGAHFQKGFAAKRASPEAAQLGFVDLRDPRKLTQQCAGCHLGDATRVVDHRLIAAGHPQLRFEAGSQVQRMPAHWPDRGAESRAWRQRTALVGQAVALKAQMEQLAREAAADATERAAVRTLDFASFDCASCHHDLENGGWRALRDYRLARGRPTPVGLPRFESSRFVTAGAVAAAAGPELERSLQAAIAKVEEASHSAPVDASALREAATAAAAASDRVAQALAELADPQPAIAAALAALARDAEKIAAEGIDGARQASGLLLILRDGAGGSVERDLVAPFSEAGSFDPAEFALRLAKLAQEK